MFDKVNFPITWQRVGSSEMKIRSWNVDAFVGLEGGDCNMESRQRSARHGHPGPPTNCAPVQLATALGSFSRSEFPLT